MKKTLNYILGILTLTGCSKQEINDLSVKPVITNTNKSFDATSYVLFII
ncbi:hypothetical protein SAMN05421821_103464 [Mucilaginibacter lappiensis]|uniref:PBP1b-binding outer membrane lipoprotein LpoB n=1 Tax=Mucilaginibacter lappiensis TaxID=354630 RepID=A0ABR6PHZ9_9SPHI|nr:PBP1b-binding outer membrane lipoprotein LpoB [Mucilaginibacter lappiensis]SIQ80919.1 hypothetical protein SAMN05421821_103464 [Mucilaginibacter lappiensis]